MAFSMATTNPSYTASGTHHVTADAAITISEDTMQLINDFAVYDYYTREAQGMWEQLINDFVVQPSVEPLFVEQQEEMTVDEYNKNELKGK